jgi:hypothetical protein
VRLHLLPLGRGRFELYAEPPDTSAAPLAHDAGRLRQWLHRAGEQWRHWVDIARSGEAAGRIGRWRNAMVCRLADSIEEQRTMWSLRTLLAATVLFPSNLDRAAAQRTLEQILAHAQRHHGRWLVVDLLLFIASGVLFFVPGPNIVAYYLGFRTFGHLQSWRGARRGRAMIAWTMEPNDDLAALAELAQQPHERRAAQVAAIAERLDLRHLAALFERAAR